MKNKFYISILLFFCLSVNVLSAKYEEDYTEEEVLNTKKKNNFN